MECSPAMSAHFRQTLAILLLSTAVLITGCAGGNAISNSVLSGSPNMTGNWSVSASSSVTANSSFLLGGSIAANQGTMTATLQVLDASNVSCFPLSSVVPFTGTLQSNGTFALTSASMNGQVVTISGSASSTGSTTLATVQNATYSVTGGCADKDHGNALAQGLVFLDGTYSGATQAGSNASAVTANFHATSTANTSGAFSMNGSLSFQGSSCFTTIAMSPTASYIVGELVVAQFSGKDNTGEASTINLFGSYTDSAIHFQYTVQGGSCNGEQGSAILNL